MTVAAAGTPTYHRARSAETLLAFACQTRFLFGVRAARCGESKPCLEEPLWAVWLGDDADREEGEGGDERGPEQRAQRAVKERGAKEHGGAVADDQAGKVPRADVRDDLDNLAEAAALDQRLS